MEELAEAESSSVVLEPAPLKGSCHKCGGLFSRSKLKKTVVGRCHKCLFFFHTTDCGNRLALAGVDVSHSACLQACPKCSALCACGGGVLVCNAARQMATKRGRQEAKTRQAGGSHSNSSTGSGGDDPRSSHTSAAPVPSPYPRSPASLSPAAPGPPLAAAAAADPLGKSPLPRSIAGNTPALASVYGSEQPDFTGDPTRDIRCLLLSMTAVQSKVASLESELLKYRSQQRLLATQLRVATTMLDGGASALQAPGTFDAALAATSLPMADDALVAISLPVTDPSPAAPSSSVQASATPSTSAGPVPQGGYDVPGPETRIPWLPLHSLPYVEDELLIPGNVEPREPAHPSSRPIEAHTQREIQELEAALAGPRSKELLMDPALSQVIAAYRSAGGAAGMPAASDVAAALGARVPAARDAVPGAGVEDLFAVSDANVWEIMREHASANAGTSSEAVEAGEERPQKQARPLPQGVCEEKQQKQLKVVPGLYSVVSKIQSDEMNRRLLRIIRIGLVVLLLLMFQLVFKAMKLRPSGGNTWNVLDLEYRLSDASNTACKKWYDADWKEWTRNVTDKMRLEVERSMMPKQAKHSYFYQLEDQIASWHIENAKLEKKDRTKYLMAQLESEIGEIKNTTFTMAHVVVVHPHNSNGIKNKKMIKTYLSKEISFIGNPLEILFSPEDAKDIVSDADSKYTIDTMANLASRNIHEYDDDAKAKDVEDAEFDVLTPHAVVTRGASPVQWSYDVKYSDTVDSDVDFEYDLDWTVDVLNMPLIQTFRIIGLLVDVCRLLACFGVLYLAVVRAQAGDIDKQRIVPDGTRGPQRMNDWMTRYLKCTWHTSCLFCMFSVCLSEVALCDSDIIMSFQARQVLNLLLFVLSIAACISVQDLCHDPTLGAVVQSSQATNANLLPEYLNQ